MTAEKIEEPTDKRWNKVKRLAVASVVAPHLRENAEKAKSRRVTLVDKDGNVTGYTTWAKAQEALLERQKIEISVVDGVRPNVVPCTNCGVPIKVKRKSGRLPTLCSKCSGGDCIECGKPVNNYRPIKNCSARCCTACRRARQQNLCVGCGIRIPSRQERCKPCNDAARVTTTCKFGHPKTGVDVDGKRFCPICRLEICARYRERRRQRRKAGRIG